MNHKDQDPLEDVAKLNPFPRAKDDEWAGTPDGDRVLGVILNRINGKLSAGDELVKKGDDAPTAPSPEQNEC